MKKNKVRRLHTYTTIHAWTTLHTHDAATSYGANTTHDTGHTRLDTTSTRRLTLREAFREVQMMN